MTRLIAACAESALHTTAGRRCADREIVGLFTMARLWFES
jgi:hypothetical protein